MVASRTPRQLLGELSSFPYERFIESIDWNRVLIQSMGDHRIYHKYSQDQTCGLCIQAVLLRTEE